MWVMRGRWVGGKLVGWWVASRWMGRWVAMSRGGGVWNGHSVTWGIWIGGWNDSRVIGWYGWSCDINGGTAKHS